MTILALRMARLLLWAERVIRYEYLPRGEEAKNRRAWLRDTSKTLDEIRQRMGL